MEKAMKNVAVLGYGTVGSGVVEIIEKNKKEIAERAGDEVGVKYILDLRDFPGDPYENKVIHDFNVIVNDPEVDIVVETMGGTGAARFRHRHRALPEKRTAHRGRQHSGSHRQRTQ